MSMQGVVQGLAPENFVRVRSVRRVGTEDVYNMEVDEAHNYAINGGLIVHNCESLRYGLMSRPSPSRERTKAERAVYQYNPLDPVRKQKESGFLNL